MKKVIFYIIVSLVFITFIWRCTSPVSNVTKDASKSVSQMNKEAIERITEDISKLEIKIIQIQQECMVHQEEYMELYNAVYQIQKDYYRLGDFGYEEDQ